MMVESMSTITTTNTTYPVMCRTCMRKETFLNNNKSASLKETNSLNSSKMFSINKVLTDEAVTIIEILQNIIPQLQINQNDALPKHVCEKCLQKLIQMHQFQEMCLKVDQQLRELFQLTIKTEETNVVDPLDGNVIAINSEFNNILKVELNEMVKIETPQLRNLTPNNTNLKVESKCNEINNDCNLIISDCISKIAEERTNVSTQEPEIFTCDVCGNVLSSRKNLKRHKKLHTRREENADEENNVDYSTFENGSDNSNITGEPAIKTEIDILKNVFTCETCGSHLASRKNLQRHSKIHLRSTKDTNRQLKKEQKPTYKCTYCSKVFQQSSTLKDHLRVHTGEQPFLCSECGKAFKSLSNMKQHLLRHNSDKRYECPHCPKKFPCLSDLASHKAVHFKNKSHVCDLCGAGFVKPYQLKKHKMYHNGEKPHKCEYCEMRFVLPDHMRRHMRTHTGEKPYKCKYCPRAFTQSNDLIKHLRGHLGDNVYKCELCPQGFRLIKDLRVHFATHKNEDDETRSRNLQALHEEEKIFK